MYSLSNLKAPKGSRHSKKRVGRGQGSGWGKTAGRGGKGQKARTGNMHFEGFEGGQMPMQRRFPKFGFLNPFRREWVEVNLSTLERVFAVGDKVDAEILLDRGVIKDLKGGVKVLARGSLTKALTLNVHRISEAAKAAVEKAGGKVELVADKELNLPKRGEGYRFRKTAAAHNSARPSLPAKNS
ncbi:MAG: 50S ribosomal protein L15 [Myxococcales bacterium]|jgi:large subunit ribosomal protein L15|nr:50S ribosomal protein L15 [Myxococcales bacterium]